MTITEFMLARIAEDEAVAKACLEPANMHPYGDERIPAIKPDEWGALVDNYLGGTMGTHCARHTPTRVLAECAAKRAIIAEYQSECDRIVSTAHDSDMSVAREIALETALSALAAVYADHPDYLPEWAL